MGHAGGKLTAAMVAGDDLHGEVRDPRTVWRYEHRAAAIVRMLAKEVARGGALPAAEIFTIRCDATNQDTIEKAKVHMSLLEVVRADSLPASPEEVRGFSSRVARKSVPGDIQKVYLGTAQETYSMVVAEMTSVGFPTWEERARARQGADATPGLSTYIFGVDAGPDNVGMAPLLRASLSAAPTVSFLITFCFAHQFHLIVQNATRFYEEFVWEDPGLQVVLAPASEAGAPVQAGGAVPSGPKYWSRCATVANVWRSPGVAQKLRNAADGLFDAAASAAHFSKIPGRPLRGRWGRIDSIESVLVRGRAVLGPVFSAVFQNVVEKKRKAPRVGTEEDERFKTDQKNYRYTAVTS
eukprot:9503230-Pyramimonas_sp.AAC.1